MARFFIFGLLAFVAVTHVRSEIPSTPKSCSGNNLPGEHKSASLQCRAKESVYSGACKTDEPAERCKDLNCASYRGDIPTTVSIGPALDGTWCGDQKMCYHGECIACEGKRSLSKGMDKFDEQCEPEIPPVSDETEQDNLIAI